MCQFETSIETWEDHLIPAKRSIYDVDMQVSGRWKSSQMPAHYAKAELAERGAIARFKDGK